MAGCCTGSEIDLREMKTAGQKQMGNILGPLITAGISQGATPFTGQLSAGPDPAQMAAMNAMMGIGGQGAYNPNPYPTMGAPGMGPGPMVTPIDYGGGGSGTREDWKDRDVDVDDDTGQSGHKRDRYKDQSDLPIGTGRDFYRRNWRNQQRPPRHGSIDPYASIQPTMPFIPMSKRQKP